MFYFEEAVSWVYKKRFLPSLVQFRVVWRGVIVVLHHGALSFQTTALKGHEWITVNQTGYTLYD